MHRSLKVNLPNIKCSLSKSDFLTQLPHEIACHILMFLDDVRCLVSASAVSKAWYNLCRDNLVWKQSYTLNKSWMRTLPPVGFLDYRDLYIRRMWVADRWRKGTVSTSYLTGRFADLTHKINTNFC